MVVSAARQQNSAERLRMPSAHCFKLDQYWEWRFNDIMEKNNTCKSYLYMYICTTFLIRAYWIESQQKTPQSQNEKKHPLRWHVTTRPLEGVDLSGQVRCEICEARRFRNSSCLVPLVMSIPRWWWESSEGWGILDFQTLNFFELSSVCLTNKNCRILTTKKPLRGQQKPWGLSPRLHIQYVYTWTPELPNI